MDPYNCCNNGCCAWPPPVIGPLGLPLPMPYPNQGGQYQYQPIPPQPSQVLVLDPLYGGPVTATALPPVQLPTPHCGSYFVVHHSPPPTMQQQPPLVRLSAPQAFPQAGMTMQPPPQLPQLPMDPNWPTTYLLEPTNQRIFGSLNASSVEIKLMDIALPVAPGRAPITVTVPILAYPAQARGLGAVPFPKAKPRTSGFTAQASSRQQPTSTFRSTHGQTSDRQGSADTEADLIDLQDDEDQPREEGEVGQGDDADIPEEQGEIGRGGDEDSPGEQEETVGGGGTPPIPWRQGFYTPAEITAIKASSCKFCLSNNETLKFCSGHKMSDEEGRVTCPVLRRHVCRYCGATGDAAHTLKYCPLGQRRLQVEEGTIGVYDTIRSAVGGYTIQKY